MDDFHEHMVKRLCQDLGFGDGSRPDRQEVVQMTMMSREPVRRRLRQMAHQIRSKCGQMPVTGKDSARSDRCRAHGNDRYQRRDVAHGLELYHEAVLWAPDQSESLALAYGNRSAAYFELGQFAQSLADIQLALDNGYDRFRPAEKLHQRKAQCLARIQDVDEVQDGRLLDCYQQQADGSPFSSQVRLDSDTDQGRFVRAHTAIDAGDVILMERPYASVLLEPYEKQYCHHCCRRLDGTRQSTPVPCTRCSQLLYCSSSCRTESWDQYHRVECPLLPFLYQTGIGHLALRVFLVTDPEAVRRADRRRSEAPGDLPAGFDRATLKQSYDAVCSLVHHQDKFPVTELVHYAMAAALLAELWCGEHDPEMVARCLLRHLCQAVTNGHAISHLMTAEGDQQLFRDCRIGTGIYPSISMLNHSCQPNVVATFERGNVNIIRACKPILAGDQVSNCYGVHFARFDLAERQSLLMSQYFFRCRCAVCLKEQAQTVNAAALRLLDHHSTRIDEERRLDSLREMAAGLEKLRSQYQYTGRSLVHLGQLYDQLGYRFYVEFGRTDLALDVCQRSLAIVREAFGPNSIELCYELIKMADLAWDALSPLARHYTDLAVRLLAKFVTGRSHQDSCFFQCEYARLQQRQPKFKLN